MVTQTQTLRFIKITIICVDQTICKIKVTANQCKKRNALFSSMSTFNCGTNLTLHLAWFYFPAAHDPVRRDLKPHLVVKHQLRTTDLEDQVHLLVAGHSNLLTRSTFLFQTVVCQSCFNGILCQHCKAQRTRSVTEQKRHKHTIKICILL